MNRAACIEFIEHSYFGSVMQGDVAGIMQCFTADAAVVIRHGDNPERYFTAASANEATDLLGFYDHLCGNFEAWFGDFEHYIDIDQARAASRFTVRLTPKPDGLYADQGVQELHNCNFFEFRDDRISHMIIYYANPQSADAAVAPTGYPK